MYEFIDAALRTGLATTTGPGKGILDEQSCILKMVLAISTVVEGSGQSEIGYRLFESVRDAADRTLHNEVIEIKSLPFLVLVVGPQVVSSRQWQLFPQSKEKDGRGGKGFWLEGAKLLCSL